jgi:hypothetical protein
LFSTDVHRLSSLALGGLLRRTLPSGWELTTIAGVPDSGLFVRLPRHRVSRFGMPGDDLVAGTSGVSSRLCRSAGPFG